MPRPAALTKLPSFTSDLENINFSLDDYIRSLSATDKLAFLNAIRSGSIFNFTPTS